MLEKYGVEAAVSADPLCALKAADVSLVKSGTITLEAALMPAPMIIIYKLSSLSYSIMKFFAKIPFIGLPNIVAGRKIVPELIQEKASAREMAAETIRLLKNKRACDEMISNLREVKRRLGKRGASKRAAKAAVSFLEARRRA